MRAETVAPVILTLAIGLGGCTTQPGAIAPDDGSDIETTASGSKNQAIPARESVLMLDEDGLDKLVADMEAGKMPTECEVLYDEEGMLPSVTVTDEEGISEIYALLADVTVVSKSQMSVTDSYHFVSFTLQDGTPVVLGFEGDSLLYRSEGNYEVTGTGPLWAHVRNLQADATGGNRVYSVNVTRDDTDSIEDCPTNVEGGSWASFVCSVKDDEEVHAFVNGKEINKVSPIYQWVGGSDEKMPTGKKKFEFYVPEEDVEIEVVIGRIES